MIYVIGGSVEDFDDARDTVFAYCLIGSSDVNGDGGVDFSDFSVIAAQWLQTGCMALGWCNGADIDRSGDVGIEDLLLYAENWLDGVYPSSYYIDNFNDNTLF